MSRHQTELSAVAQHRSGRAKMYSTHLAPRTKVAERFPQLPFLPPGTALLKARERATRTSTTPAVITLCNTRASPGALRVGWIACALLGIEEPAWEIAKLLFRDPSVLNSIEAHHVPCALRRRLRAYMQKHKLYTEPCVVDAAYDASHAAGRRSKGKRGSGVPQQAHGNGLHPVLEVFAGLLSCIVALDLDMVAELRVSANSAMQHVQRGLEAMHRKECERHNSTDPLRDPPAALKAKYEASVAAKKQQARRNSQIAIIGKAGSPQEEGQTEAAARKQQRDEQLVAAAVNRRLSAFKFDAPPSAKEVVQVTKETQERLTAPRSGARAVMGGIGVMGKLKRRLALQRAANAEAALSSSSIDTHAPPEEFFAALASREPGDEEGNTEAGSAAIVRALLARERAGKRRHSVVQTPAVRRPSECKTPMAAAASRDVVATLDMFSAGSPSGAVSLKPGTTVGHGRARATPLPRSDHAFAGGSVEVHPTPAPLALPHPIRRSIATAHAESLVEDPEEKAARAAEQRLANWGAARARDAASIAALESYGGRAAGPRRKRHKRTVEVVQQDRAAFDAQQRKRRRARKSRVAHHSALVAAVTGHIERAGANMSKLRGTDIVSQLANQTTPVTRRRTLQVVRRSNKVHHRRDTVPQGSVVAHVAPAGVVSPTRHAAPRVAGMPSTQADSGAATRGHRRTTRRVRAKVAKEAEQLQQSGTPLVIQHPNPLQFDADADLLRALQDSRSGIVTTAPRPMTVLPSLQESYGSESESDDYASDFEGDAIGAATANPLATRFVSRPGTVGFANPPVSPSWASVLGPQSPVSKAARGRLPLGTPLQRNKDPAPRTRQKRAITAADPAVSFATGSTLSPKHWKAEPRRAGSPGPTGDDWVHAPTLHRARQMVRRARHRCHGKAAALWMGARAADDGFAKPDDYPGAKFRQRNAPNSELPPGMRHAVAFAVSVGVVGFACHGISHTQCVFRVSCSAV